MSTGPNPNASKSDLSEHSLPMFFHKISIYKSAVASFYVPSDVCGWYHSCWYRPRLWWHARNQCCPGQAISILLLQRHWIPLCLSSPIGDSPDEDTGMWVIGRDHDANGYQILQVIDLDTVIQCAHLIRVYGPDPVNTELKFSDSLYAFHTYYVNKYMGQHSFEIVFWYLLLFYNFHICTCY